MSAAFTQGSISTGESAGTLAEIKYFREAFYTREALLAIPEDIEVEEKKKETKSVTVDEWVHLNSQPPIWVR